MLTTTAPLVLTLAALMSGAFFLTPIHAAGDDLATPRIEVFGTAEQHVVPDSLDWRVTVETTDLDQFSSADLHTIRLTALMEHLRSLDLEEKDLRTDQTRFSRVADRHSSIGDSEITRYRARTTVVFRTRDLAAYGTQWLTLATMADVNIDQVSLRSDRILEVQGELRLRALRLAREKAEAMARELGMKVGDPIVIEEVMASLYGPGSYAMANALMIDTAPLSRDTDNLEPGTIPVSRQVRVVFAMEKAEPSPTDAPPAPTE
jgi:uncharacterized protein YggE